jgi:hypothetical protein
VSLTNPQRHLAAAVLTSLFATFWSCWLPGPPPSLLPDDTTAPEEIREACSLTSRKCTRCHTIDRVLVAPVATPRQWEIHVERMRRMPSSGISESDAVVIVRCLVHRSFGE